MIVVPLFFIAGLGFLYPAFLPGTTNLFLVPTLWQALCRAPELNDHLLQHFK